MGILQLNFYSVASLSLSSSLNHHNTSGTTTATHVYYHRTTILRRGPDNKRLSTFSRGGGKLTMRATETTIMGTESEAITSDDEPPSIDFIFVDSMLLPDGTPDVHTRSACGGQKLRDVMLDNNIELYGPYARPLLNCGGGGTCGTCMVEVVEGKELLNLRTDREKKILKKKPKTWRLACQTTVGEKDSRGQIVIQQLPEWKAHEWGYITEPAAPDSEDESLQTK